MAKNFRTETDTLGDYQVREDALYGSQTKRSFDALHVTNRPFHFDFIKAILIFKKAIARAHLKNKKIADNICQSIIDACDEILNKPKEFRKNFITDQVQGGAGTSINMNVNEVLANLASLKLGKNRGQYYVSPNDIVNMGQSTNDVFPSTSKFVFYNKTKKLIAVIKKLQKSLHSCSKRFEIIRLGKTHLQDAVPMKMSEIFTSWAHQLDRDILRLQNTQKNLLILNIGGTAIGTGISNEPKVIKDIYEFLKEETNVPFQQGKDLVDLTRNTDVFLEVSNNLKTFITSISKNCSDLRFLSSGPSSGFSEIIIPNIQPGSSIMPGKVNPIIPETINQIAFLIIGHNATITSAVEAGELELNVFEPVIFSTLHESFKIAIRSCELLIEKVLKEIKPRISAVNKNIEYSSAFATVFVKKYGYNKISKIVHSAILNGQSVKEAIIKELNITAKEYKETLKDNLIFPLESKQNEK